MNSDVLTATSAFQCLVESTKAATETPPDGEWGGFIPEWMDQDWAIGMVIARTIVRQYEHETSPAVMTAVLRQYCRKRVLDAFVAFYGLGAAGQTLDVAQLVRSSFECDALVPLFAVARSGKSAGWQLSWGIALKEPFEREWLSAFYDA